MKTLYFSREDRLSALPDLLILKILALTPVEDVVKTTILSKRWKDLWTTIPDLHFHVKDPTRKFVHQLLLHWKGNSIRTFEISFVANFEGLVADLDSWVRFATEKKVENLTLNLPFDVNEEGQEYWLPRCVYSCSSIKELRIRGCQLEIMQVEWDELESLNLECGDLSEDVINHVVSSAPRLENLELRLCRSSHDLNIESNSLKRLLVNKYNVCTGRYDPSCYKMLTIWAPKLESLHLWGNAYSECNLRSSLTHVALCFYELWSPKLAATLLQILPAIKHVEAVTLSPCAFKMLGVIQARFLYPPFWNVKKLKVHGGPITPMEIVGLAQVFPQVETLVIDWKLDAWYPRFLKNLSSTYQDQDSEEAMPFLKQLRTVEIISYSNCDDSPAFQSIFMFLSDHAAKSHKTVIRKGDEAGLKPKDELKAGASFQSIFKFLSDHAAMLLKTDKVGLKLYEMNAKISKELKAKLQGFDWALVAALTAVAGALFMGSGSFAMAIAHGSGSSAVAIAQGSSSSVMAKAQGSGSRCGCGRG